MSNLSKTLGIAFGLCVLPCIGQDTVHQEIPQFRVTGEIKSAETCLVRTKFITGRMKEGISEDLSLRLTIDTEIENIGTSAATLLSYEVSPAYGTADTLKCAQDEKCLHQINIDCFVDCESPEHLSHQVSPVLIAPGGRFYLPDAAQFDVQLSVKGLRFPVGDNYLRFWLQLETTTTKAPDFVSVHSEPVRFTLSPDIRLVRDHLSARLKAVSAGLNQQICEPEGPLP